MISDEIGQYVSPKTGHFFESPNNILSENSPAKSLRHKLTELLISLHDGREIDTETWTLSYCGVQKKKLQKIKTDNRTQMKTVNHYKCKPEQAYRTF